MAVVYFNKHLNRIMELHHLGKLDLNIQVRNPHPRIKLDPEPDIGEVYGDAFLWRRVRHDFYVLYEAVMQKRGLVETVSFEKPVRLFGKKQPDRVWAESGETIRQHLLFRGLVPNQHPIVTDYSYDAELAGFDIPTGTQDFFEWEYVKKTQGSDNVEREVRHRYMPVAENWRDVIHERVGMFVPYQLYEPLYQHAPPHVLDVLGISESKPGEVNLPGFELFMRRGKLKFNRVRRWTERGGERKR